MPKITLQPGNIYKTEKGKEIYIHEESSNLFVGFPQDEGKDPRSLQFLPDGRHIMEPELKLVEFVCKAKRRNEGK